MAAQSFLRDHPDLCPFLLSSARPTGKTIGTGPYGSVEEVAIPGAVCAAKKIHDFFQDPRQMPRHTIEKAASEFVRECQLMSTLRHPHIVQFLGVCFLPGSPMPALVMEKLVTSLHDVLDPEPPPSTRAFVPVSLKRSVLHDVARGLSFLHSVTPEPIIHRDLSARNVLLNEGMVAKIADLGMARILPSTLRPSTMTKAPGASIYMPPEALEDRSRYDTKIDIFSLGVLAIFTFSEMFPDPLTVTYMDEESRMMVGRSELERRGKYMAEVRSQFREGHPIIRMIEGCLKNRVRERPNIQQVCGLLEEARGEVGDGEFDVNKLSLTQLLHSSNTTISQQCQEIDRSHQENVVLKQQVNTLREENDIQKAQIKSLEEQVSALRATSSSTPVKKPVNQVQANEFEVIAMYSYPGQEQGDLVLVKGQKYIVFDETRPHWWRARDERGREGYVPSNYVKKVGQTMEGEEWFFPNLSRTRAEDILKEEAREGGFVVRNLSQDEMYVLSIYHKGKVRHYHIKHEDGKYYFIDKHRFPTINKLIEYHKLNGEGLVTRLRKPLHQLLPQLNTLSPLFDEELEINKSELTLGRELGSGQFKRVVAGKWKGKIDVAVVMMKEGAINEEDFIEKAKIMRNFQHENLVKLYGVCTGQGPVFIIQELMAQGCLLQYIRNRKELAEKDEVMLDMALQICAAMKFLESNGFIHRDLAARNCLVGERNVIKVTDIGMALFVVDDEYTASEGTKFPIKWAAPEVIIHAKFSSKSDVWSYGILMWELWSGGKTPYPTFTNPQVLDEVLMGYRLEKPRTCKPEVYAIMQKCWNAKPEERPSFRMIHQELKQMDRYNDRDFSDFIDEG